MQDKEAIKLIDQSIRKECNFDWDGYCVGFSPDGIANVIMVILERLGYHKGLEIMLIGGN